MSRTNLPEWKLMRKEDSNVSSNSQWSSNSRLLLWRERMSENNKLCATAKIIFLLTFAIIIGVLVSLLASLFVSKASVSEVKSIAHNSSNGTQCSGSVVSGSTMCCRVLVERQSCILGRENNSGEVIVVLEQLQHEIVEQQLSLLQFLPISERCGDELLALLCVEAYMGYCGPSGVIHRTSRQNCDRIITEICSTEFEAILPLLLSGGYPTSCDDFPERSNICSSSSIHFGSGQDAADNVTSNILPFPVERNCSEGFYLDKESDLALCTPECGEWWPQTPDKIRLFTIFGVLFEFVGLLISIIGLILSCLNYKKVFNFSSIFIFYQLLSSFVYIGVILLNSLAMKSLMCKSKNLVESLTPGNETPFCVISAAIWIYISLQVALWWIFHLLMIFIGVLWPFKYRYWKEFGYIKYIHFTMVVVGLILPIIPVIVCLQIDGYVLYILYRPLCVARNPQVAFYSHILPLILAVGVGLYLLILIFWKLLSEECKPTKGKRQVELKILLLLLGYIIMWTDAIGVSIRIVTEAQDLTSELIKLFTCEATGTEECQQSFEQFDVNSKLIALFLLTLYPGVFLIYFIKPCC